MEQSPAAVGAVRRLRSQAPQQQHHHHHQGPENNEDGRHGKKSAGGGCPRLLSEAGASLPLLLYLLGLRVLVHVSFQRLVQAPRDPKEFDALRASGILVILSLA
uniref:Uncharacterized protein n=1 Tax=Sphaerodactylus townsendi TaxID=933632 RepID=A0ACB8ERA1_9SAUR